MAKWIKTNGGIEEVSPANGKKDFSLEELQAFVGGYIAFVYLSDTKVLVVNEEGLLRRLPKNQLVKEAYGIDIVGNALLATREEVEGDDNEEEGEGESYPGIDNYPETEDDTEMNW